MSCPHRYSLEQLLGSPLDLSKAEEACRAPCTIKKGDHQAAAASSSAPASTPTAAGGWLRDLTAEGVESNPGPVCCRHAGCVCTNSKNSLRAGVGLAAIGMCECSHPIFEHDEESASSSSAGLQRDADFDSFLSALDAAQAQQLPFHPSSSFLALLKQPGATAHPRLLGAHGAPGRMFIRDCYPKLFALLVGHKAAVDGGTQRGNGALISGNSGVGKTSFLVYIMKSLRAMKIAPKIVFEDLSTDVWFVLRPGAAHADKYDRHTRSCDMELDSSTWYLVDTGAKAARFPTKTNAFTIVAASPHAAGLGGMAGWSKEQFSPPNWLMPCWGADELEVCRHLITPTAVEKGAEHASWSSAVSLAAIETKIVARRFQEYGGIARVAFASDAELVVLLEGLESAYEACDLGLVARFAGSKLQLLPETSSWLLHYDVDPSSFRLRKVDFASDAIMTRVWEIHAAERTSEVLAFINATSGNPVWSTAAGKLFENFIGHLTLRRGGTFPVQRFSDPISSKRGSKLERHSKVESLTLPPAAVAHNLPDAAAIGNLAAGEYGQPSKENFPTIDGALKPNMLFQMTVGSEHGVNIDGLVGAVQALGLLAGDPPPRLYFVVPPMQFATFRVGSFVSSGKKATAVTAAQPPTPVSAIPKEVEFWVLQLYATTGKRKAGASTPSPPPSPKAAAKHRTLPAPVGDPVTCSCKGPCKTTACGCKAVGQLCHAKCHSALAKELTDPLAQHKNCTNHQEL